MRPPPYNNAYWNGSQMVCGISQCTDDTVGHELTHGVIDFTANLYYYMQSGAINESLADIMGEFIDLGNGAGNDAPSQRWLFSEDSGAIRNMSNPPAYGHPDRMLSTLYSCGASDNGGVHSNSGVSNKAAVLMTDGGTFNGKTVVGLGITKVAKIYYEAFTKMLVSASDYGDLYYAVKTACSNLTATGVTTTADCLEVTKALDAVEMNQQPTSCPAPDAPLCDAGKNPVNLFFDDFESGPSKWLLTVVQGADPWSDQYGNLINHEPYASSGTGHLWGYDNNAASDSNVRTASAMAVPSGAYLHFMHAYDFQFDAGGYYDGGVIEYSTNGTSWSDAGSLITSNGYPHAIYNGSNPLNGRSAFTGLSNGYVSSRLDLSSLAGSNVYFRFRIGTDSSNGAKGWFIDDVRVYTCVSSDAVLPILSAFSMPSSSTSLTVTGITITASDNVGVTGYYLSESSVKPLASAVGWLVTKPTSYTFASVGSKTLYLWVKDAAGNISNMLSATVSITDSVVPTISVFTMPATSVSLTVTGISITASDNIGITGYYLSESSVTPLASAPGWLSVKPTSYVFSSLGSKTLYLWVKDGAGNVSSAKSATTMITIATTSNILQNGNFESGHNIWTEYCSDGSLNSIIASNAGSGNNGSSGYAAFGGFNGLTEYIYQDVTIPADASAATLSFYYYITTTESSTTTAMYDNLYLEILNPTTSATLATLTSLSNVDHNSAWTKSSDYNLLSYKGSTVRIRFRSTMDSTLPTTFNIDDVVLNVTTPGSLPLTVAVTGSGSGSVHSSPEGISCASGSSTGCSANFSINSSVTLLPTPSGYSLLSGWSGCDSSSVSQCIVAMNDARNVTATFTAAPRVKVGSKPFDTLQDAYNDAATTNNAIIKLLGGTLGGAFTAAGGKDVTIEGGYNADFSANPDMTVVDGPIVLQSGSVTVEGVAIK
ncbi:MAG: M4 family metallopeptidase [Geobacteraceae bacterium]|nr:M4 family metallopeptidase [Geobacteraceae bacterium]